MGNSMSAAGSAAPAGGQSVDFIDFGCGSGKSITLLQTMTKGQGYGIDISEQAVSECWEGGLAAEVGDLLDYQVRNAAAVTSAIDLLPEIGDRLAFEAAVSNLILAARNYTVIQHQHYDADLPLAQRGLHVPAHFGKRIRFKPGMADYVRLVSRIASSHAISGVAIYGIGEAKPVPLTIGQTPSVLPEIPAWQPAPKAYRAMRVVIGRKAPARFQAGVRRARGGDQLFLWQDGAP